ncbi:unnamed protein product [Pseudo-nitzschia multistriata]|uniref:Uncharacterized protein n=1 Tax=Pseudo-nitzschia multistriata TaxID=183589 RepID=A0A448ZQZ5_9STRA|nr:unnamed protein product [Pseudo-nitzschia multistriata]
MDHSLSDGSGDEDLPLSHPARIGEFGSKNDKNRGGWGESMELAHQREAGRRVTAGAPETVVAVDLSQFRNTEVGRGYQARHVVRQRSAAIETTKTTTVNDRVHLPRARDSERPVKQEPLDKEDLLRNEGLRLFRKEIESILASP